MSCPVCGGDEAERFDAKYVTVARCHNGQCGHLWAVGAAPGQGVQQLHEPVELIDSKYAARDRDLVGFLRRRGFLRPGSRLLEFGAGSGHVARAILRYVPDVGVVAVEADVDALAGLRSAGIEAYASLTEAPGVFDAVNLIEVVEHLDDPVAVLDELRARLKPGGQLFCTTPCGQTRTGDRNTNAYDTPEHIHFFTERSLGAAFKRAGFASFELETINSITSRLSPPPARYLKDVARPIRAALRGHVHLTGFATAY